MDGVRTFFTIQFRLDQFLIEILGCQIHYYTECLILAYKLNRTVVFNQTGFLYNENGWNEFYQPASETCLKLPENFSVVKWPGKLISKYSKDKFNKSYKIPGPENEKVLTVTHDAEKRVKSHYPGRRLPADLAERIKKISSTPMAWFNGQIQKYFQRSTDYLKNKLKETLDNVGFDTPIVGIHVRRTDKLRGEAQNFSIEAYMEYAEEYFDQLEITQNISKRRVYICTDDPNAITELRTKYSHYEIYSNEKSATDADEYKRYSRSSFENLLHEIEILTLCSYVVCTLSSNICRLVYENFEALYSDPIKRLKSLDYNFDTAGENVQFGVAIQNHNSSDISMQIGDKLYLLAVNDTFVRDITNIRTSKSGKVPSFKVEFIVPKIKFATYPEVK